MNTSTKSSSVVITLYRQMMKQAKRLDEDLILKICFPLPEDIATLLRKTSILYKPNSEKYTSLVQQAFRNPLPPSLIKGEKELLNDPYLEYSSPLDSINNKKWMIPFKELEIEDKDKTMMELINLAFKMLESIQKHHQIIAPIYHNTKSKCMYAQSDIKNMLPLPKYTASALSFEEVSAMKKTTFLLDNQSLIESTKHNTNDSISKTDKALVPSVDVVNIIDKGAIKANRGPRKSKNKAGVLPVGLVLLAHPISSGHQERRTLMVVESNEISTETIMLDVAFNEPISAGHPLIPEIFWGHSLYNGGYYHIEQTLPPSALISVLHTLPPPTSNDTVNDEVLKTHMLYCKPLIQLANENKAPLTLYHSKAEALSYLSNLAKGKNRDSVQIYWGNNLWPTKKLMNYIKLGHYWPVSISPSFFNAYTDSQEVELSLRQGMENPVAEFAPVVKNNDQFFATEEELSSRIEKRLKNTGKTTIPPEHFRTHNLTVAQREPLWDQIMFAMGGEYTLLSGMDLPIYEKNEFRGKRTDEILQMVSKLIDKNTPDNE